VCRSCNAPAPPAPPVCPKCGNYCLTDKGECGLHPPAPDYGEIKQEDIDGMPWVHVTPPPALSWRTKRIRADQHRGTGEATAVMVSRDDMSARYGEERFWPKPPDGIAIMTPEEYLRRDKPAPSERMGEEEFEQQFDSDKFYNAYHSATLLIDEARRARDGEEIEARRANGAELLVDAREAALAAKDEEIAALKKLRPMTDTDLLIRAEKAEAERDAMSAMLGRIASTVDDYFHAPAEENVADGVDALMDDKAAIESHNKTLRVGLKNERKKNDLLQGVIESLNADLAAALQKGENAHALYREADAKVIALKVLLRRALNYVGIGVEAVEDDPKTGEGFQTEEYALVDKLCDEIEEATK
jgi:hypothetical protein